MNDELIRQLCVLTWLPTIIVVWLMIVLFPPRLHKRKK